MLYKPEFEQDPSIEKARSPSAEDKIYPFSYKEKLGLIIIEGATKYSPDDEGPFYDPVSNYMWRLWTHFDENTPCGYVCCGEKPRYYDHESEPTVEKARSAKAVGRIYPLAYKEKLNFVPFLSLGSQGFHDVYIDKVSGYIWESYFQARTDSHDGYYCIGKSEKNIDKFLDSYLKTIKRYTYED